MTVKVSAPSVKRHHRHGCKPGAATPLATKRWEHVTCGNCIRVRKVQAGA